MIAVTTLYNAGIGQVEHLNVRHRAVDIVNVRSVQRTRHSQRLQVVGRTNGLHLCLQFATSRCRDDKIVNFSDTNHMTGFRKIV